MRFGSIPEQRTVRGSPFPLVLFPDASGDAALTVERDNKTACCSNLPLLVRENKNFLEDQLCQSGALLLRGFDVKTAKDFQEVVEAFGWEDTRYIGPARRTQVSDRVFTANESPGHDPIPFHHEMSQIPSMAPSKLMFFCETEPCEGGQTPILPSGELAERMLLEFPEFFRKLEAQGIIYTMDIPSQADPSSFAGESWQSIFMTTDKLEAEKRAAAMDIRLEWLEQQKARAVMGPFAAIKTFSGKKIWFNSIVGMYTSSSSTDSLRRSVYFEDGSSLPEEAVEGCATFQKELSVAFAWRQGDVVVINNLETMHGRLPWKTGPRRILVSLSK